MDTLTTIRSLTPNAKAKEWRDEGDPTLSEKRQILCGRVGLIALAVLIAGGVAVGCYFLANSTETVRFIGGGCGGGPLIPVEPFERSLAPLCVIPGTFGGVGILGALTGASTLHVKHKNGRSAVDLKNKENREKCLAQIKNKSLQEMYDTYHGKNGGLAPLVHHGILTMEEGDQLRQAFAKLKSSSKEISTLEAAWTETKKQFENHAIQAKD